jgi:hypothetical protein
LLLLLLQLLLLLLLRQLLLFVAAVVVASTYGPVSRLRLASAHFKWTKQFSQFGLPEVPNFH